MYTIFYFLVFLTFPVLGQVSESILNTGHEDGELFHGADHYDFALILPGTETQCYWHFARQTGHLYLTYMVQFVSGIIADRHMAVSIFSPEGILLSFNDNAKGQINLHAKETGFYKMCFTNYNNHFGDMRVFLNFGVFYEEFVETQKDSELNSTLASIKDISNKIQTQIQHMWRLYNVARMQRGADYFLLQSKSNYVKIWSALQSFLIIMAGYVQLFCLKRFFNTDNRLHC